MNAHNIFSEHLHTVPGKGLRDLEDIFSYSIYYKKLRLTITYARFVEKEILAKLGKIEKEESFFTKKNLWKTLQNLEARGYLTDEQCDDIMTITEGRTPRHEVRTEKIEKQKEEKPKKPEEMFGHEPAEEDDYEQAATIEAEEKDVSEQRDADFERYQRNEELRKMSDGL